MDISRRFRSIAQSASTSMTVTHFDRIGKRQLAEQLRAHKVTVVFDVGANSGQFASGLRRESYDGRIVSFEPLSGPFELLQTQTSRDPLWESRRCALGAESGTITINVAGNAGESSSILPMLETHQEACPPANYIGTEDVSIARFDEIAPQYLRPGDIAFLKIDVQGFEEQVLAGGGTVLQDSCIGLQLEMSIVPLYEGGMVIREALNLADSLGFTLTEVVPAFTDPRDGRILQVDGTFFRP